MFKKNAQECKSMLQPCYVYRNFSDGITVFMVGEGSHKQDSQGPCDILSAPTTHQLTKFIHSIDISVAGNELFHHALHRQAGRQDQCGRPIRHAGIQVCGAVPDENLGEGGAAGGVMADTGGPGAPLSPLRTQSPHLLESMRFREKLYSHLAPFHKKL